MLIMNSNSSEHLVVVYHEDCIDGAASAWAFHQKWKDDRKTNIEYIPYSHHTAEETEKKILSKLRPETQLYFADVSPSPSFLDILLSPTQELASVTITDHHKTAAENLAQYSPPEFKGFTPPHLEIQIMEDAPSASGMVWKKFFPDKELSVFLKAIEKMDRDGLTLREDFEVAALIDSKSIRSIKEAFETCSVLCRLTNSEMIQAGREIYAEQEKKFADLNGAIKYTKLKILPDSPAVRVPIINANVRDFGRLSTKFLQELGDKEGSNVAFAWYKTKDKGSVVMSIRSRGVPDASVIARYFSRGKDGITGGGSSTMAAVNFPSYEIFEKTMHITANGMKVNNCSLRTKNDPHFY